MHQQGTELIGCLGQNGRAFGIDYVGQLTVLFCFINNGVSSCIYDDRGPQQVQGFLQRPVVSKIAAVAVVA